MLTDDTWFRRWRSHELARVDEAELAYLDYTGTALYPASLVERDATRLQSSVLGNPHSEHQASLDATADVERARAAFLSFLNADPAEYVVILTPNATGACRLVGEAFPFGTESTLMLSQDNHNSINGLREFATARGAGVQVIPLDGELRLVEPQSMLSRHQTSGPNLLAFPAQSNFSGVRHPLSLIPRAQSLGYRVLLDAAAYLPTASLDLATVHPDFVVLSLYKIAGYPTGIGALVARRSALESLRRPWFAGGTVDWVSVGGRRHQLRAGSEGFEDGTPPFLAAGAVAPALAAVAAGDRIRLARYLTALTARLLDQLGRLTHSNGGPVITIHGPTDTRDRGATVAVTVCAPDGSTIPYWEVEAAARREGLAVRGGCFCNPGCAERAFDLEARATQPCFEALGKTFSIPRFAACLGTGAVGAIRLSLGLGSIGDDVDRAVHFFRKYVDVSALSPVAMTC